VPDSATEKEAQDALTGALLAIDQADQDRQNHQKVGAIAQSGIDGWRTEWKKENPGV
jgi:hypothetical protein